MFTTTNPSAVTAARTHQFDCSSGQFGASTHTFRDVQLRKPRQLSSFFLEMRDGVYFACGSPHFSPAYIAGPAQHFFACFCSALGRRVPYPKAASRAQRCDEPVPRRLCTTDSGWRRGPAPDRAAHRYASLSLRPPAPMTRMMMMPPPGPGQPEPEPTRRRRPGPVTAGPRIAQRTSSPCPVRRRRPGPGPLAALRLNLNHCHGPARGTVES